MRASHRSNLAAPSGNKSALNDLAALFPSAMPLRIPMLASMARDKRHFVEESILVEFGTATMVLFESRLPLELADNLFLKNADGSLEIQAVVVAMRINASHRAIAVRFIGEPRNWIVQY